MNQNIGSQQKTEVSRAKEPEKQQQQQQITNNYTSLSHRSESEHKPSIDTHHLCSSEAVTAAVSEVRDKLQPALFRL